MRSKIWSLPDYPEELTALHLTAQIIDFRVILGVKTCEVFLCFLVIIFLGSVVLAASLY